jgi:hypothetical protein
MHARFHRQLNIESFHGEFEPEILEIINSANLAQDGLLGLLGHPEYHFDDNAFEAGNSYIQTQRQIILDVVHSKSSLFQNLHLAWKAFGRLLHASQDFYAHSNYTFLWLDSHPGSIPVEIDALDPLVMGSPSLHSGRIYYPLEFLYFLPPLRPLALQLLPHNSHAWMNLDGPERGPLFAYVLCAARKRSRFEFDLLIEKLNPEERKKFTGLDKTWCSIQGDSVLS